METAYLLSTPANAAHLAKSIAQHKDGKVVRRELVDVGPLITSPVNKCELNIADHPATQGGALLD